MRDSDYYVMRKGHLDTQTDPWKSGRLPPGYANHNAQAIKYVKALIQDVLKNEKSSLSKLASQFPPQFTFFPTD